MPLCPRHPRPRQRPLQRALPPAASLLCLVAVACGGNALPEGQATGVEGSAPAGSESTAQVAALAQDPETPPEPEEEPAPPPVPLEPVQRSPLPLITPIDAAMRANLQRIAARNPELRDDVFAKMGGSSVVLILAIGIGVCMIFGMLGLIVAGVVGYFVAMNQQAGGSY